MDAWPSRTAAQPKSSPSSSWRARRRHALGVQAVAAAPGACAIDATDARELGLLTVIATVDRAGAAAQRPRLAEAGIRASTSLRRDGHFDVLVFSHDADRARELLR